MKFYVLAASVFLLTACSNKEVKRLPIFGNREAVEKTVDGKTVVDTVYQSIPEFGFINQDSTLVTNKNFDGKIYVADFFFTTCPSICPIMHRNMLKAYEKFKGNKDVAFLSHSIDPKYDTPHVLKKYATKLGLQGNQWEFVNGPKDSVYTIAEKNYLVFVSEDKDKASGGFVHQGYLVLIDKEKRVRGAYDGTKEDQVQQMILDMQTLLDEYK